MKQWQFHQEIEYGAALAIAKALLCRSLITQSEYRKVQSELIRKHRPVIDAVGSPINKRFSSDGS